MWQLLFTIEPNGKGLVLSKPTSPTCHRLLGEIDPRLQQVSKRRCAVRPVAKKNPSATAGSRRCYAIGPVILPAATRLNRTKYLGKTTWQGSEAAVRAYGHGVIVQLW